MSMSRGIRRKSSKLQDRDFEILEHVYLYRLTTREVLHKLFFELSETNAVTKVTSRLCNEGFLVRYPLVGPSSYFILGKRAAKMFGMSLKLVKPMGPQSLYMQYATLGYCCMNSSTRRRLSVSELKSAHPGLLFKKMDASPYVVDSTEAPAKIVFLSIDGGATADHVVRKTRAAVAERAEKPLFAALMDKARFAVACVTYHDDKRTVLAEKFSLDRLPCNVSVETVPQLLEIQVSYDA